MSAAVKPAQAGPTAVETMAIETSGLTKRYGRGTALSDCTADIGYLAQDVPLYRRLSAEDHIRAGAQLNQRWDGAAARARLRELDVPLDRAVGTLSGGQRAQVPDDSASLGSGLIGAVVEASLAVPALLGMFLGAPAVAREVETGTAHFAWTQAVTRRHWLTVKTCWLLLAALVWGGAVGALVTWWSGPRNAVAANQFSPGTFDVQGIMPAVYSLFAMALGIARARYHARRCPTDSACGPPAGRSEPRSSRPP